MRAVAAVVVAVCVGVVATAQADDEQPFVVAVRLLIDRAIDAGITRLWCTSPASEMADACANAGMQVCLPCSKLMVWDRPAAPRA